jgi:uncharacterized protein YprB with RNaseH-like and TPR domain
MDLHDLVVELKQLALELGGKPTREQFYERVGSSKHYIEKNFGGWSAILRAADLDNTPRAKNNSADFVNIKAPPRIMYLDIETAPIEARVWGRWEQNVAMNQITRDWFIMSFAAELDGQMHYLDQRYSNPIEDDSMLMVAIHHLMGQADIIYGWNSDKFDLKKLNARFFKHKMTPPTSFRSIDGLKIVKNKMALTSNKLDDVAKLLGIEGKLHSDKFPGQELWNQCLAGNMEAWQDMETYNKQDVLVLKEVMKRIDPWHSKINFSVFEYENKCSCGSTEFKAAPVKVTNAGKFQRVVCSSCGKEFQLKTNLVHPDTRKELMK